MSDPRTDLRLRRRAVGHAVGRQRGRWRRSTGSASGRSSRRCTGNGTWRQIEIGIGDRDAWLREAHAALETQAGRPLPPLHQHWRERQHWITPNIELIRRLRPPYRTAVLSNADNTLRGRFKAHDGICELFDDVRLLGGRRHGEAGAAHLRARGASASGCRRSECVFIDDLERNLEAAREAGMTTVHFRVDQGHSLEAQLAELGVAAAVGPARSCGPIGDENVPLRTVGDRVGRRTIRVTSRRIERKEVRHARNH